MGYGEGRDEEDLVNGSWRGVRDSGGDPVASVAPGFVTEPAESLATSAKAGLMAMGVQ